MKALIVEDDKDTVNFLSDKLEEEGFSCDCTAVGEEGLRMISKRPYDIAAIDIKLDGRMSGIDLIKSARGKGVKTPIIVLSALSEPCEKIAGLNAGADDYIGKPFAINEFMARVYAQIRRTSYAQGYNVLTVKDLTLCHETHEVKRGGRRIALTAGEYSLLELLMRNTGRTVTTRMILHSVWELDFAPSKIVETRICALRKKLCANDEPNMISTIRGFGYVLQ